ncbi:hypothetical protein ABEX25_15765 [Paenibacillus thiaminolyticus]|uniref:hypothetical protein n=1 Tax=Paenibacillus thiaminolyticus TaxID=49283 RepID=UPI003D272935
MEQHVITTDGSCYFIVPAARGANVCVTADLDLYLGNDDVTDMKGQGLRLPSSRRSGKAHSSRKSDWIWYVREGEC